ncbi:MAG: tetratricopeptide repeat protein [Saprospiraceae bacterium]
MRKVFPSILWFAFWLASFSAFAQERYNPDSLLQVLDKAEGHDRVEILRHLSRAYIGADKEKSIGYAKESLVEAEKLSNDTFIVRCLNNLAAAYQNCGDHPSSNQYLDRAIEITRRNGNRVQLLECLEFKATALAGRKQTDKALPFAQEALKISEELKDSVGILNALEIIAAGHKDLHLFEEAIKVYQQEIALLEHMPKRLFEKGRVSVNLGEVYVSLKRRPEAIALFEKGRQYFIEFGYPIGALIASLQVADCYLNDGQAEKAGEAYRNILEGNKAIQEPELGALAFTGLGVIEMEKRNYPTALGYYKQAEASAKPAGLHVVLKNIYDYMNDLYCLQGDYETAKSYKELSKNYADSVLTTDVRDRISELQIQYETTEKELKIAEQKSEIFRTNALNYGLGGSLLAFLGFGYLFYNRFRLRKKAELDAAIIREQKLGLSAVIEAQEAERKRIARDLHDGIAQELVALKLGFDALSRRVGKVVPEESPRFAELGEQLDNSCTEVRSIAHVMSPPVLEQQGLAPSLELLLRHTLQHAGLEAKFNAHDLPLQLDEMTEIGLYRIAQELLNNVVKHARAAKVMLELYSVGPDLLLRVEDDGTGFDFEAARSRGTMGVLNILSRVSTLGGEFLSERRLPKGTIALVRVPV